MKDIFFRCRHCHGGLRVVRAGAGRNVPCPLCKNSILIPDESPYVTVIDSIVREEAASGDGDWRKPRVRIMVVLREMNYDPKAFGVDDADDLTCDWRLDLALDTNSDLRLGHEHYVQAQWTLDAFPGMELIVAMKHESGEPCVWKELWHEAGGRLHGGRMVAMIHDPIWMKLSEFERPYPPYRTGSGMWVRLIDYTEMRGMRIRIGGFTPPEKIERPPFVSVASDTITSEVARRIAWYKESLGEEEES